MRKLRGLSRARQPLGQGDDGEGPTSTGMARSQPLRSGRLKGKTARMAGEDR